MIELGEIVKLIKFGKKSELAKIMPARIRLFICYADWLIRMKMTSLLIFIPTETKEISEVISGIILISKMVMFFLAKFTTCFENGKAGIKAKN